MKDGGINREQQSVIGIFLFAHSKLYRAQLLEQLDNLQER